jgi:predicted ArsR family transcriptional regulator
VIEQARVQGLIRGDIADGIGGIDSKATTAKQGKYIKTVLDEVKHLHGVDGCKNMMRSCGYQCISNDVILIAKGFYKEANNEMEPFLERLNANHIAGGRLRFDQDAIIVTYDRCYCGIPKAVKNMPKEYCECSAGWAEKLFSSVFEKSVKVEMVQTILAGGDQCVIRVAI